MLQLSMLKINTFFLRFKSPNPVLFAMTPFEGVMHTSDLFYLFSGKGVLFFISTLSFSHVKLPLKE